MPLVKFLLKLIVSVGLILLIVHELQWRSFWAVWRHADLIFIILAVLCQMTSTFVAALRWRILMQGMDYHQPWSFYIKVYFIGNIFNQVLPSSVGGDVVRMIECARHQCSKLLAVRGVLLDRVYGTIGLLLLNLIVLYRCFHILPWSIAGIIALVTIGGLFATLCLYYFHKVKWIKSIKWLNFFVQLSENLFNSVNSWRDLPIKLLLACAPNFFAILNMYCLSIAIGLHLSFSTFLVIIPSVILLTLIPISLAGWGVREGAMVGLFLFLHVAKNMSLSLSLMFGVVLIIANLPGIYFYLHGHHRRYDANEINA